MNIDTIERVGYVEGSFNYLADLPEKPSIYMYEPPAGVPARNSHGTRHLMRVYDGRAVLAQLSLDSEGFAPMAKRGENGAHEPVKFAHNDYTIKSGPQRVRDLVPDEADRLLGQRFALINLWRPIRGPVEESPLAVCDAH